MAILRNSMFTTSFSRNRRCHWLRGYWPKNELFVNIFDFSKAILYSKDWFRDLHKENLLDLLELIRCLRHLFLESRRQLHYEVARPKEPDLLHPKYPGRASAGDVNEQVISPRDFPSKQQKLEREQKLLLDPSVHPKVNSS